MFLHKIRKDFHRYQHEQKLPRCLRHNLTKVTIHNLINNGIDKDVRLKCFNKSFPENFYILYSSLPSGKLNSFIYNAFSFHNVKAIRLVFCRFNGQLKHMIDNNLLHIRISDHFISVNNMHISKMKYKNWYKLLKLTVDTQNKHD